MDQQLDVTAGTGVSAQPPAVVVEGVSTDFLRDVSLRVEPGETAVVFGRSGCGKSTLVRALLGLVPLTAGTVRGMDGRCAFIPQDMDGSVNPRLKVDHVVTEPIAIHDGAAAARAARAEVPELLDSLGLDSALAHRRPRSLSGGQRARVGIARAVMGDPQVIVADEPLAALDEASRDLAMSLLKDSSRTVIMVSHDVLGMAEVCDRWFIMDAGHVVESGTGRAVLDLDGAHPARVELVNAAYALAGR